MQTLKIGRSTYTLSPARNVGELHAKFAKCTGKPKKPVIAKERRGYPEFKPGDSTADYVKAFYAFNALQGHRSFFAPLNSAPCALYSGEDLHEELSEFEGAPEAAAPAPETAPEAREALAPMVDPSEPVGAPGGDPDAAAREDFEARHRAAVKANPFQALAIFQTVIETEGAAGRIPTARLLESEARRIEASAAAMLASAPQVSANYSEAARHLREAADVAREREAPAPGIDGLDVAELGADGLRAFEDAEFDREAAAMPAAEFKRWNPHLTPEHRAELQRKARASVAGFTPSLRIPAGDPRLRIPARFAPVSMLRGAL